MIFPLRQTNVALLVGFLIVFSTKLARCEEPAKPAEKQADVGNKADANGLAVPAGTNEELLAWIEKLQAAPPEGNSREEMLTNAKQKFRAIISAADKILTNKPDEKTMMTAASAKLEALAQLSQFGDKAAEKEIATFAGELLKSKNQELAKNAQVLVWKLRARHVLMGDTSDAKALIADIAAALKASPNDKATAGLAISLAQALEYSEKANDLALPAYRDFTVAMAKSTDKDIAEYAAKLAGVVRRLELVGKPMPIAGTLLDGKPFNPATLKGKVVLVDFWATWCGPCVAELPNVQTNYDNYHSKGFEVVGISLDDDRATLEKFIDDRKVLWPILFETKKGSEGMKNPLAEKYGVMGIPTAILVGADGNVISLNARGKELTKQLEKLLGPVEAGEKN
jgi:thiol-disulfide isomerase/thioredoxin